MSLSRRNPRRDDSEPEIVLAFMTAHKRHPAIVSVSVQKLSGAGVPDLLVGFTLSDGTKVDALCEVKSEGGKLTADQVAWHKSWAGSRPFLAYAVGDVDGICRWVIETHMGDA